MEIYEFYFKLFSMLHCSHAMACIKILLELHFSSFFAFILHEIVINSSKKNKKQERFLP
jgi:hypothetical protein